MSTWQKALVQQLAKRHQHVLPTSDIDHSISDVKLMIKDHCFSIWQQQYISNSTALKYKNFISLNHRSKFGEFSISFSFTNWSLQIKCSHALYEIARHRIMFNLFGSGGCQPFFINMFYIRSLEICFKIISKFHGFISYDANTILSNRLIKSVLLRVC